ncbi:hypothetical protein A2615_04930 [Candidatus Curtissbacteria bacterium RIFOXYD1_FULL_41_36]|nr:MAG: hypothetical protein A2615_04930 [Candidatus Curtissbacteria bacterium RIFOXYD1_FULL_41_36]
MSIKKCFFSVIFIVSLSILASLLPVRKQSIASQNIFSPVSGFGTVAAGTKKTDGFTASEVSTQNCNLGTCSSNNSWNLGFDATAPVVVNTQIVFSYDLSSLGITGSQITELTFNFAGCWHGGSGRSCNNGKNPGFDSAGGKALFEVKKGNNWEQLDPSTVVLGTSGDSSSDGYATYQVTKSSGFDDSYLSGGIMKVRVRTTGKTTGSLDVYQVTDFASLTITTGSDPSPSPSPSPNPSPTPVPTPTPTPDPSPVVSFTDATIQAGILVGSKLTWGLNWADYDSDGNVDLFVNRHFDLPVLYHSNGNGTFNDVSQQAGVRILTDRHGCAWGDYNADTFLDLYCSSGAQSGNGSKPNQLFKNNTDGTFTDVATELGVVDGPGRGRSVNWFDYDGDGFLDLYMANFMRNGYPSRLFRQDDNGSFSDVASVAGVAITDYLRSSSWSDYNGDGKPDLLVAAGGRLYLHKNRGDGTFTSNSASEAKLTSDKNFGGAWGDFDNDGDQDLFVSRLYGISSTSYQNNPSILYQNNGDGTFHDVTASSGIAVSMANLGQWGDYDNDGDLDLFVVNGRDRNTGNNVADSLYMNNSDGTFTDVADLAEVAGPTSGNGDSAAWADYNKDGFLDLLVTNGAEGTAPGPVALYKNSGNNNHWLELKLKSIGKNTFGYGAKITITADGKTQFRELTDQVVQYGQNDQIVHFGLGSVSNIDAISIKWPNGTVQQLTNLPADQIRTVLLETGNP